MYTLQVYGSANFHKANIPEGAPSLPDNKSAPTVIVADTLGDPHPIQSIFLYVNCSQGGPSPCELWVILNRQHLTSKNVLPDGLVWVLDPKAAQKLNPNPRVQLGNAFPGEEALQPTQTGATGRPPGVFWTILVGTLYPESSWGDPGQATSSVVSLGGGVFHPHSLSLGTPPSHLPMSPYLPICGFTSLCNFGHSYQGEQIAF